MAIDEMKLAWQEMDRRLSKQEAFITAQVLDTRLTKARRSLLPLHAGQIVQMIIGVAVIVLGVAAWSRHADVPHVFAAGIVVHVYGVLMIALGGIVLGRIHHIDYAAPVTVIQRELAALRVLYIRCGMLIGLPWWVLWVPFAMVLVAVVAGVDMYARVPAALNAGILFGIAGLIATWLFHRWTQHPSRVALRARLDDSAAGGSLKKARQIVEEIAQFEKE